jgi:hypothetical protein
MSAGVVDADLRLTAAVAIEYRDPDDHRSEPQQNPTRTQSTPPTWDPDGWEWSPCPMFLIGQNFRLVLHWLVSETLPALPRLL